MSSERKFYPEDILANLYFSDEEGLNESSYPDSDDFESEFEDDLIMNDLDGSISERTHNAERATLIPARSYASRSNASPELDTPPSDLDSMDWIRDTSGFTEEMFSPTRTPGPMNLPAFINYDSTPSEYLSLVWDENLWNTLVTNTNNHAVYVLQRNPNSLSAKSIIKDSISIEEMKAFFALRGAMEMLLYKDRYEQYWRTKNTRLTYTPGFAEIMSRDRFLAIWSLLHCVDENDPNVNKSDKIYKTRPIFNSILEKFQHHYAPGCNLSLDEGMIPTKNKLSFRQYIKDKPTKWGIKTFLVCDSENGYICNAEVYTGKREDNNCIPSLGVTGNLVVRLCEPFYGQNHIIYMDRFYTSVRLADYLLRQKVTRICGTTMTNRKHFPKMIIKRKNEMGKGESDILYNGSVGAIAWQDKKNNIFYYNGIFRFAEHASPKIRASSTKKSRYYMSSSG
uniref:piggyBac transposable element-derived protein 4-like n=1 Tax=Styela clava TaxID=7725 RepID=UPI00193A1102|nr:piggyBac transposable element-derived protein 4-like [Styela clava]